MKTLRSFSFFNRAYEAFIKAEEYLLTSFDFISTRNAFTKTEYPGSSCHGTWSLVTTVLFTCLAHSLRNEKKATPLFPTLFFQSLSSKISPRSL